MQRRQPGILRGLRRAAPEIDICNAADDSNTDLLVGSHWVTGNEPVAAAHYPATRDA